MLSKATAHMPVHRSWLLAGGCALLLLVSLVGCQGFGVKPAAVRDLFNDFSDSFNPKDDISFRTRQTLRQYDLESVYDENPRNAFERLWGLVSEQNQLDVVFAIAEVCYRIGCYAESKNNPEACEFYYLAAGSAYHYLFDLCESSEAKQEPEGKVRMLPPHLFDPRFRLACELYNITIAKCLRNAQKQNHIDSRRVMTIQNANGTSFQIGVQHQGFSYTPEEFGPLLFCADYDVTGFKNLYRTYGLGVPMIGEHQPQAKATPEFTQQFQKNYFPVTAFFRFHGKLMHLRTQQCGRLELYNPWQHTSIFVHNSSVPLETDLTTPLAYFLSKTDFESLAYKGFIFVGETQRREGIYMLEPYQPGKIPVLMVHGLLSSPLTWAPMLNDLLSDPRIRDHYQFWFYLYPTGNPYMNTAENLREAIAGLRKQLDPQKSDEALGRMVVVGHSMGGLISRLLTIPGGDDFWRVACEKPIDQLKLEPQLRVKLENMYYFRPIQEVERAVFLGTPHRGSQLSPSVFGKLGRKLICLPDNALQLTKEIMEMNPGVNLMQRERLTSVDMLSPDAPALKVLSSRPKPAGVKYHTVLGIIPGGNVEKLEKWLGYSDGDGDGVVPVSSAHLDDADSELKVMADHSSVHHHPLAVQEVRRILYQHLENAQKR